MARRTILHLAPVHRPWGNRVIREAEFFAKNGYEVFAIMNTRESQVKNGVSISPTANTRFRFLRFARIPYLFFRAARFRADIYHLHNPDMIPVAFGLAMLGRNVVYDTHEDFSRRLALRNWIPKLVAKPLGTILMHAERCLSQIVAQTLVTQPRLVEKYGQRTSLIRNLPKQSKHHLSKIRSLRQKIDGGTMRRAVYIGLVSKNRGLITMLDALVLCNQRSETRLWLAGQQSDNIIAEAKLHPGWKYVDWLGLLQHEQGLAYAQAADVGICVLEDIGDHKDAQPTKIFEYISVGTPFIASNFDKWKEGFTERGIGVWIEPNEPHQLAKALHNCFTNKSFLQEQVLSGSAFVSEFNWESECKKIEVIYNAILKMNLPAKNPKQ